MLGHPSRQNRLDNATAIVPKPPCVRAATPQPRNLGAGCAVLPQMVERDYPDACFVHSLALRTMDKQCGLITIWTNRLRLALPMAVSTGNEVLLVKSLSLSLWISGCKGKSPGI